MVKPARPYMSLGIDELTALAKAKTNDAGAISDIIDELGRRSTKKARELLRKLTGDPTATPRRKVRATGNVGHTEPTDSRDDGPGSESPDTSKEFGRELTEAYELLRETFTVESEILARWGMTTALPRELRDLMFSEWRRRLARQAGTHGRSMERLEADVERLRTETADVTASNAELESVNHAK
jgi:hypothetical protein